MRNFYFRFLLLTVLTAPVLGLAETWQERLLGRFQTDSQEPTIKVPVTTELLTPEVPGPCFSNNLNYNPPTENKNGSETVVFDNPVKILGPLTVDGFTKIGGHSVGIGRNFLAVTGPLFGIRVGGADMNEAAGGPNDFSIAENGDVNFAGSITAQAFNTVGSIEVKDDTITGDNGKINFKVTDKGRGNANSSDVMTITADGKIGIGTMRPKANLDVRHYEDSSTGSILQLLHARGTEASPVATCGTDCEVNSGDVLGRLQFAGYDGRANVTGAEIIAKAGGVTGNGFWGTTGRSTQLMFYNTPTNKTTLTERLRIEPSGRFVFLNSNPIIESDGDIAVAEGDRLYRPGGTNGDFEFVPSDGLTPQTLLINSGQNIRVNIDGNNNESGRSFTIGHNQTTATAGHELFVVQDSGNVGIGTDKPATELDVNGTITAKKAILNQICLPVVEGRNKGKTLCFTGLCQLKTGEYVLCRSVQFQ